jgi:hypothetical protein
MGVCAAAATPSRVLEGTRAARQGQGRAAGRLGGSLQIQFLIVLSAGTALLFMAAGFAMAPGKRLIVAPSQAQPLHSPIQHDAQEKASPANAGVQRNHISGIESKSARRQEATAGTPTAQGLHEIVLDTATRQEKNATTSAQHSANAMTLAAGSQMDAGNPDMRQQSHAVAGEDVTAADGIAGSGVEQAPVSADVAQGAAKAASGPGFARLFMARTGKEQDVVGVPRPFELQQGQRITLVMAICVQCYCV